MVGVLRNAVAGCVVDGREHSARRARAVRGGELGRHDAGRAGPEAYDAGGGRDRLIGSEVLDQPGRAGGDRPGGRAAVHLAGLAVAGGRVRCIPVLLQPVGAGGNRLCPHGFDAATRTGLGPTGRDLLRHHAAQVVLDRDVVDHSDGAADVPHLERAAIVRDRAVGFAEAERGGRAGVRCRGETRWRGRRADPRERRTRTAGRDHRPRGVGVVEVPAAVLRECAIDLEPDHGGFGQVAEVAVDEAGIETERREEGLDLPDGITVCALGERPVRHLEVRRPGATDGVGGQDVVAAARVADHLHRRPGRGAPGDPCAVGDDPDGADAVELEQTDPDPSIGRHRAGHGAAVVVIEDPLPRLVLLDGPAVGPPLAHATTVTVADAVDDHRDDVVWRRLGDRRRTAGDRQQREAEHGRDNDQSSTHATRP